MMELAADGDVLAAADGATPAELQLHFLEWRARRASHMRPPVRWMLLAAVRAELGDLPGAAEAGRNALAERARGLPMMLVDPRFDALRGTGALEPVREAVRGAS